MLYSSLNWALEGIGKFSALAPLIPGKGPRFPLSRKLGASESWSRRSKDKINPFHPPRIKPQIVHLAAKSRLEPPMCLRYLV